MSKHPFVYQRPDEAQVAQLEQVRAALRTAYDAILLHVPPCAERTLAVRKLEEASMWANKAIVFDGERYI